MSKRKVRRRPDQLRARRKRQLQKRAERAVGARATCPNCGTTVESPWAGLTLDIKWRSKATGEKHHDQLPGDFAFDCPTCGTFMPADNAVEIGVERGSVTVFGSSKDEIDAARAVAEMLASRSKELTAEETADLIEQRIPGLRTLSDEIRRNKIGLGMGAVGLALAVLGQVQGHDEGVTENELRKIVRDAVRETVDRPSDETPTDHRLPE